MITPKGTEKLIWEMPKILAEIAALEYPPVTMSGCFDADNKQAVLVSAEEQKAFICGYIDALADMHIKTAKLTESVS